MTEYLKVKEAVSYLRSLGMSISKESLGVYRATKRGPRYYKLGHHVRYIKPDLDEYFKKRFRVVETVDSMKNYGPRPTWERPWTQKGEIFRGPEEKK